MAVASFLALPAGPNTQTEYVMGCWQWFVWSHRHALLSFVVCCQLSVPGRLLSFDVLFFTFFNIRGPSRFHRLAGRRTWIYAVEDGKEASAVKYEDSYLQLIGLAFCIERAYFRLEHVRQIQCQKKVSISQVVRFRLVGLEASLVPACGWTLVPLVISRPRRDS